MKRILIIEDHAPMRRNLALILKLNGYAVTAAENGRLGVEAAKAERPDLILCDVMMPELDGYGVLEALRGDAARAAVPFIFLTAKGDRGEQRRGFNLGADDYLTKPVDEADLLPAVRARLERSAQFTAEAAGRAAARPDFSSPEPLRALGLTPREAEVLLWVAQGKSTPDIAVILGTAAGTAKRHVCSILAKLGVETRTAAAAAAIEKLMESPPPRRGSLEKKA